MHCRKHAKKILLYLFYTTVFLKAGAQTCVDDYFQVNYTTSTVQYFSAPVFTKENEILFTGTVNRFNSILEDGWLTKLSLQGTLLFSRHYTSGDYNWIQFRKAIPADADNFFVAGNIGNVDTTTFPIPTPLTQYGFLMKVDKYGGIIWTKLFGKVFVTNLSSQIDDIIALSDGDYIFSLSYTADNSTNIIVRIDIDGNIKWTTTFTSLQYRVFYGPAKLKQLKNGNLLLAQETTMLNIDNPYTTPAKQGYYAACFDSRFGTGLWNNSYIYAYGLSSAAKDFGELAGIAELPNGDLSFIASYADTAFIYFRKTTRVINIVTDFIGRLKTITSYQNTKAPVYASSAADAGSNGDQVVLMDNADAPYLMYINAAGQVQWQNAYAGVGRSQETKAVLNTNFGNYFFSFTHNGGSTDVRLVKTDVNGNADCVQTPLSITTENVTAAFQPLDSAIESNQNDPSRWYDIIAISVSDYRMSGQVVCKKTCCTDVTDTATAIDLCNALEYRLPNNDLVKNTGTYNINYKTSKGCDSIVYYNVRFSKSPDVSLGIDLCLDGKDSVILKTTPGYAAYSWNGAVSEGSDFIVKQPGTYSVSVTNACGTNKDTVEVFQQCEFTIYMPTAFTPNADNLNDYFRIPKQVSNRLVSFNIYNRWGQVIFSTTDIKQGWNGNIKAFPAPPGSYAYYIVMKTVDGKRTLTQKGLVTLLR